LESAGHIRWWHGLESDSLCLSPDSCREFEEVTFHHPDVVKQAESHFTMIKVDVTRAGNPIHEQLLKHYAVKGVPTVVFVDAQQRERLDLRLVDFLPPDQFLNRMSDLMKSEHDR
jgi:thiol:disulfide interchange protein DsbD